MRRKTCREHNPGECPFLSGDTSMGPARAQFKTGQMGHCGFFNPEYQCPHHAQLKNRPGRSLVDRLFRR